MARHLIKRQSSDLLAWCDQCTVRLCERVRFHPLRPFGALSFHLRDKREEEPKKKKKMVDAVLVSVVALLALRLIGPSSASPLPQLLNHGPLPLSTSSPSPSILAHFSRLALPTSSSSSSSLPSGDALPTGNEQVGRVQLPSPWEPQQFNLPFSVSTLHYCRTTSALDSRRVFQPLLIHFQVTLLVFHPPRLPLSSGSNFAGFSLSLSPTICDGLQRQEDKIVLKKSSSGRKSRLQPCRQNY